MRSSLSLRARVKYNEGAEGAKIDVQKEVHVNSRERVRAAIERSGPDRVPLTHATLPGALARHGQALEALYQRFPSDVLNVGAASEGEYGPTIGVPSRDTWGSLWVRYTDEHKGQVVNALLADWNTLDSFTSPDTSSAEVIAQVTRNLAANRGVRYTLADGDTLWQRMFYLHGYEAMLQDLLLHPDRCAALRDMILKVQLRRVQRLCALSALDGVHFRDDWGTQQALMISPALWRSFFKPAYAQLFAVVRGAGKHVWFHSDGVINAIIPDLIEIGAQVLNPQVPVVGREQLKALAGQRLCIEADVDRQWVLPFGAPEDVRAAVRADLRTFASLEGGYIGRGEVAGDVPLENVAALFEEVVGYAVS
jgi:uroporphyrinogen decarboxylase